MKRHQLQDRPGKPVRDKSPHANPQFIGFGRFSKIPTLCWLTKQAGFFWTDECGKDFNGQSLVPIVEVLNKTNAGK